jgi:hypothetical protein
MKTLPTCIAFALGTLLAFSMPAVGGGETSKTPRLFISKGEDLQRVKAAVQQQDPAVMASLRNLRRDADDALTEGPFSVVHKEATPPSGDKHDYMSLSPYWWPDPSKADGLPYIRRDGEFNPERAKYDLEPFDKMSSNVFTLALAHYLTDEPRYGEKAIELLRVWFIEPDTRMNPNVKYSQFRPGYSDIRPAGVIETTRLRRVTEAVGLLETSPLWSDEDGKALRNWFGDFLDYLRTSEQGRKEAAAKNNHGTWYDAQTATFALFVHDEPLARRIIEQQGRKRIAEQIEPDGTQPHELERTLAFHYSRYNLNALIDLATMGEMVGVDLWNYRTDDGRSIRGALDWLLPYATGEREWLYQQIGDWRREMLVPLLRRAAAAYNEPRYQHAAERMPDVQTGGSRFNLTHPPKF